jgi:hypothetical protein
MTRKYSQRGYQSGDRDDKPRPRPERQERQLDGPKSPNMTSFREIVRCGMCGKRVEVDPVGLVLTSVCTGCRADMRTCKNCVNFDPGTRYECRAPITQRVANKTTRTECPQFTPRKTVEKQTTENRGQSSTAVDDPRAAFERLFKK